MQYDLVIKNGSVVDGSGAPAVHADVGIADGKIAMIGRIREKGAETIDAEGHVVAPGFIDGHTHMDAQVFWDRIGSCSCYHGVTSVVMGNCGFTLAPCREEEAELVFRNLERAEDISPASMRAGIKWSWETYPEYLDTLDALPKGINYAGYIGHSALRTYVMGERAFTEQATEDELAAMARNVQEAVRAGAIGFSTSRIHTLFTDKLVASAIAGMERGSHHRQRHERHGRRCLRVGRRANLSGSRVERRLLRSPTAARRRIRRALYMGAHQRPGRAPGLAYLPPAPGRYGRRGREHVRPGALALIEPAPELRVAHAVRRLGPLAGYPGAAARRAEGQAQGSGHQGQARRHRHGPR